MANADTQKETKAGETHVIDATNRALGRVASEAAYHLLGKHSPKITHHQAFPITVEVQNASKLMLPRKKLRGKIYQSYTGYPSGRREKTLEQVIEKHGYAEVVRRAVKGMLPHNKLQGPRLKNLSIID